MSRKPLTRWPDTEEKVDEELDVIGLRNEKHVASVADAVAVTVADAVAVDTKPQSTLFWN